MEAEDPSPRNARRELLGLYTAPKAFMVWVVKRAVDNFITLAEYADAVPSRKPRTPMDVEAMVAAWREAVVGMTLAATKDDVDRWEAKLNDLLEPFLKAPIKQIREFCTRLVEVIEPDPQVPWLIKQSVIGYIKIFVKTAKDEAVIELKKDIAGRIARAVEGDVAPQLVDAITNALCWRDPEHLARVEEAVKKSKGGPKAKRPRMVGRESCLFLEVGDEVIQI
jgi:hypothetical protein